MLSHFVKGVTLSLLGTLNAHGMNSYSLLTNNIKPQAVLRPVERNVDNFLVEYLKHFFMYSQEAT